LNFKYFVPFSINILHDLSLIDDKTPQSVKGENSHYKIPFGFEPLRPYPEFITSEIPYSIDENFIDLYVEIENTEKYKTLPRIVPLQSIYLITDEFLFEKDKLYQTKREFFEEANETLVNLIRPAIHFSNDSIPQKKTNCFDHMISDDLTPHEIQNMDLSLLAWERKSFQEGIDDAYEDLQTLDSQCCLFYSF